MRLSVEPSTDPPDYDFAHDIRVRFVETDAMEVVHHSNYLAYFEETRVAYLRAIGHPFTEWREDGLESPVLESYVRYRTPLRFDDLMTVHVRLAAVTRATFQMAYLVTVAERNEAEHDEGRDGRGTRRGASVRATGVTVHGCTTLEGRPTRLPGWLRELGQRPG